MPRPGPQSGSGLKPVSGSVPIRGSVPGLELGSGKAAGKGSGNLWASVSASSASVYPSGDSRSASALSLGLLLILVIAAAPAAQGASALKTFEIVGDAIPKPLTAAPGDAVRGRAIVADRQRGLCLLCHSGPLPEVRFQGNLAPSLAGAGARWNEGQLRLRIADASRLNPETIMPSYYRTEGLNRVAPVFRSQPVLPAQEIEDVVAYLRTLRD